MHRMTLTTNERSELEAVIRKRHGKAALARRARCVLLWAGGERRVDIRGQLSCNDPGMARGPRPLLEHPGHRGTAGVLTRPGYGEHRRHLMSTETLERNKRNVQAFYGLMFNQCKPKEAIERYAGATHIQHNPHVADGKQ